MVNILKNVPLSTYSNYKIGGPASFFVEIKTPSDLNEINCKNFKKIFVMGAGTNILINDEGFDGLVIHNIISGIENEKEDICVGSGVLFSHVVDFCIESSLSGLEWAGGLPGTVGGAVRGNAGAFGSETKDSVFEVESVNLLTHEKKIRTSEECEFGYRTSVFKENQDGEIITEVFLKVKRGNKGEIKDKTQEKIDYRNGRHPMDYPSLGSTFKNIDYKTIPEKFKEEFKTYVKSDPFPIVPVAKLLYLAGLCGKKIGNAQVSDKHPNFIVNLGNAKAFDVLELMKLAKNTIRDRYAVELEEEIQFLGFNQIGS